MTKLFPSLATRNSNLESLCLQKMLEINIIFLNMKYSGLARIWKHYDTSKPKVLSHVRSRVSWDPCGNLWFWFCSPPKYSAKSWRSGCSSLRTITIEWPLWSVFIESVVECHQGKILIRKERVSFRNTFARVKCHLEMAN